MAEQNEQNEVFDLFNLSADSIDTYNDERKESVFYRPSADAGKDGVYTSLIRFIPNPKNPLKKSIIRKFVYWLTDDEGNSEYFDSPSTVGDNDPIQTMFFKLRNSDSAVDKKDSEGLKRREVFYSLVQIITDPHRSELEGKIKVFKYGAKIKAKVDEELNPKYEEPTQIFDLYEGKNFELTVTKVSGFNNYDSSKFQSKISALKIADQEIERNDESRKTIMEYLNAAPELEEYEYKPWDEETKTKINNVLRRFTKHGVAVDTVTNQKETLSKLKVEGDSLGIGDISLTEAKNSAKKETTKSNVESEKEDLDGFLKDLNLG